MYVFSEEMRRHYENSPLSFVYYENVNGKAVPILASDGFCQRVGLPREEVLPWLQTGLFERTHPDDVGIVRQMSEDFLRHRGPYDAVFRCRLGVKNHRTKIVECFEAAKQDAADGESEKGTSRDNREGYVLIHGVGAWQKMPDGTELAVIAYANLNATQETIRAKIETYGLFQKDRFYTDYVTELPNSNYLHEFGGEKVAEIRSEGFQPMLAYVDVESMQSYNNQYGFDEGDGLLRLIASVLKESFRKPLVTRGADDHFILLTGLDDREKLQVRLEQVNELIKRKAKGNTGGIRVGVCPVEMLENGDPVGVAIDHARHALKRMDTNLNQVVQFFSQEADDAYWRSRYIVENLDKALQNGWIKVYYQGLIRVKTMKGAAFEALARWVDPVRGIIAPGELIPVLQKYHLLYKLDLYMFEQVCKEVRIRHENGLTLLPVSVNFSRQDFDHADVVGRMNEIYETTGAGALVEKEYFIIEITEQELAADPEGFQQQIQAIRENGYRLWLDDLGSGYSSLGMFAKFSFDLIKFDMELIRHLDDGNGANRVVLKMLIQLARELKIHTLIEGIETPEQMEFAREIGCELIQGYLYHKPEPLDEILYRKRNGMKVRLCEKPEERDSFRRELAGQRDGTFAW